MFKVPVLRVDNLPTLPEKKKPFFPYLRKKTIINGDEYLIKIHGIATANKVINPKPLRQARADALKPLFGIRPMKSFVFWDDKYEQLGIAIKIEYVFEAPLNKVNPKFWMIGDNMKTLVKIMVFDGFRGEIDRFSKNIKIFKEDGSLLATDEDEGEQSLKTGWIKFKREHKMMLFLFIKNNFTWFNDWFKRTKKILNDELLKTLSSVEPREYENDTFFLNRFKKIDSIKDETVKQLLCKVNKTIYEKNSDYGV